MNIPAYYRQKRQLSAAQSFYDSMEDPAYADQDRETDENDGIDPGHDGILGEG